MPAPVGGALRFHDRLTHPLPTARDMLRILREGGFAGKRPPGEAALVPRDPAPALPPCPEGGAALTWIGHATYVVQMAGMRIATDPVWAHALPGRIRRLTPPGLPLEACLPLDAVTVSHNHYDHLDAWTFRRLPKDTAVLCPLGLAPWFRRRGFTRLHELDWWQHADVGGVRFTCVPAHHWSRRTPWDTNRSLWCGWVMEPVPGGRRKAGRRKGGPRLLHAGDTAYGHWFRTMRERIGPVDIAMLPIGAYAPRWFMRTVHMDASEAVLAAQDLGAGVLAAMHWGTFILTREPVLEPVERVRAAWAETGRPRGTLWDLPVGGSRTWAADAQARHRAA